MANTSARMLRLLSLLQTHRYWPGAELAGRLEVSERTLRRDIDRLRDLGYPVDATRGVAGGYQLKSGAAMPPLLLDDDEAVAIAVGLRSAAGGAVTGIEEASLQALAKVIQVMPPRLRGRVEALRAYAVPAAMGGPTVDSGSLIVIAQACRDDERLRFSYVSRSGERTSRLVEPHRLVSVGRRWYLVAWDAERHDWRTFRVDRLFDPALTGARFCQRALPGGDAVEFVRTQLASIPTRYEIVIAVHASAERVMEVVERWGTVEEVESGGCVLRMSVDDLAWPTMVLSAIGADFEVLNPPELRDHVLAVGRLFARAGAG